MINKKYLNLIKNHELTLESFIDVCDVLDLPVFEVAECNYDTRHTNTYTSMSEYQKKMPDWAAREYDYEDDCATCYLEYPDIVKGTFTLQDSNSCTYYMWQFVVLEWCVAVHSYSCID